MAFQPAILEDRFWVSPQIEQADLTEIAKQGVTYLVCNRPDQEDLGQPDYALIAQKAETLGIQAIYLPIDYRGVGPDTIKGLQQVLATTPARVLAYCRSGNRSTYLWALAVAGQKSADEILEAAHQAGYGIASLEPLLREADRDC